MSEINRTTKKAADMGSDIVNEALDAVKGNYDDLKENLQDRGEKMLKSAKTKGMEAWDELQDRGEGAVKDLTTWVRRNPLPAVGWVLVAGAVIYALIRPESD